MAIEGEEDVEPADEREGRGVEVPDADAGPGEGLGDQAAARVERPADDEGEEGAPCGLNRWVRGGPGGPGEAPTGRGPERQGLEGGSAVEGEEHLTVALGQAHTQAAACGEHPPENHWGSQLVVVRVGRQRIQCFDLPPDRLVDGRCW